MSAADTARPDAGESTAEPGGMSDRTARLVLLAVACLAMWGIVAVLPETAYVVVGALGTIGAQRARTWWAGRRQAPAEDEHRPDVVDALRRLVGDDRGVLLTRLRDDLRVADTKTVRVLLDEAGVRVRTGVRTGAGNGPGVHQDDIPAPPPAHDDGCCCRSSANANANNTTGGETGEGLRVERIGQSGYIVRDPADTIRHHQVRGH
ncbi:hypothetical protein [Streptomyces sp. NPDC056337]|uniref:hypothetical protein n=1 Tax=Streptomyces sp. NPDC056337 TaxID=3345787 RepID=UPI0035E029C1